MKLSGHICPELGKWTLHLLWIQVRVHLILFKIFLNYKSNILSLLKNLEIEKGWKKLESLKMSLLWITILLYFSSIYLKVHVFMTCGWRHTITIILFFHLTLYHKDFSVSLKCLWKYSSKWLYNSSFTRLRYNLLIIPQSFAHIHFCFFIL